MSEPSRRTVPHLIGDAVREAQDLVSTEIALLRAEMTDSLHHLTLALSLFIAAGVLAMSGVVVLILALVKGLALWGRNKVSLSGLEPTRTERQVGQDLTIITERMGE